MSVLYTTKDKTFANGMDVFLLSWGHFNITNTTWILPFLKFCNIFLFINRAEYSAFWKCVQAGGAYLFTQLCKMLVLATFFPTTEFVAGSLDVTGVLITAIKIQIFFCFSLKLCSLSFKFAKLFYMRPYLYEERGWFKIIHMVWTWYE